MTKEIWRARMEAAVRKVRETCPLVPSITNAVTINFVANAQLAAGGSAAMVYLPDEGESMAAAGSAMYINMGTLQPVYAETLPRTVRALARERKPWVLDPVGIGRGALRTKLLLRFRAMRPAIVRGNASEIIALAALWELGTEGKGNVCGVESGDTVEAARPAAKALATHIGGAVAVSGETDLVTDGETVFRSSGGSPLFTKVTGSGCSLGGVTAVYAAVTDPLTAALAAVQAYNLAGKRAAARVRGPGSFEKAFLDELYLASAEEIAGNPFTIEE